VKKFIQNLANKKNLKLPFVYDVSHSLVTKGITISVGIAASIIVTRTLGPELKGVYSIVLTWVSILLQLSLFGLYSSNSYFVALNREKLKTLLANSVAFILVVGTLIAAFLLASRHIFHIPLGLPEDNLVVIIIIGAFLSMGNIVLQNLSIAIKKVNINNYVLVTAKVVSFSFLLYFYLNDLLIVQNALIVYLIELLIMVGVLIPFLNSQDGIPWKLDFQQFKLSFSYGFRVYMATILAFLVIRSDIFLIKHFLDFKEVGYYSTAVQMTDQVSVISATIAGILMPRLTMIDNIAEKKYRTKQVVRGISLMLLVVVLPLFILAEEIIVLLFSEAFLPSVLSLRILLVATAFLSLQTILVQFLASEGFPKMIVVFWLVAFVVNIVLNVILIQSHGIEGAAISSLISYFAVLLMVYFYVKKQYIELPTVKSE